MMTRYLAAFFLASTTLGCSGSVSNTDGGGEDEPCGGEEGECACLALDDGWCKDYWPEDGARECAELGGVEQPGACPRTDDLYGVCQLSDDCYSPDYFFYSDYTGGHPNYSSLAEAESKCTGCTVWQNGPAYPQ